MIIYSLGKSQYPFLGIFIRKMRKIARCILLFMEAISIEVWRERASGVGTGAPAIGYIFLAISLLPLAISTCPANGQRPKANGQTKKDTASIRSRSQEHFFGQRDITFQTLTPQETTSFPVSMCFLAMSQAR